MIQGYLIDNPMLLKAFGCYTGIPLRIRNSFFSWTEFGFFQDTRTVYSRNNRKLSTMLKNERAALEELRIPVPEL